MCHTCTPGHPQAIVVPLSIANQSNRAYQTTLLFRRPAQETTSVGSLTRWVLYGSVNGLLPRPAVRLADAFELPRYLPGPPTRAEQEPGKTKNGTSPPCRTKLHQASPSFDQASGMPGWHVSLASLGVSTARSALTNQPRAQQAQRNQDFYMTMARSREQP